MKKIVICIFLIIFIIPIFVLVLPTKADNKTLQDLLNELNELEIHFTNINNEKNLTEERLNEISKNMANIGLKINYIENTIISLKNDIENMNEEIEKKKIEINNLVNALQKNDSENFYIEFLFGSESLTDFIYRREAIEQITKYNDVLVSKLNIMIDEVKEKNVKLGLERDSLEEENKKLELEQQELGNKINMLDEDARDLLEDIAEAKRTINNYQKMGCSLNDYIENCTSIPVDSAFLRPLAQGRITSGYGTRDNPVSGGYQFHAAIDIGGNPPGTSIYASASGIVVLTSYVKNPGIPNSSCGGNFVVIQHKIGDSYYATRYMHLSSIYVTEGQKVTQNDIIGAVGGGEIYDRCSTGAHLDFSIAKGIYGQDFYLFRQPSTINPYTLINLPAVGMYYSGRYIKY